MTEPNAAPNAAPAEEQVTIPKAEWEAAQSLSGKYKEIEDRAKQVGFETVDEYEDDLLANYKADEPPKPAAPAPDPKGQQPSPAAPNAPTGPTPEMLALNNRTTAAQLEAQFTAFKLDESQKPEANRSPFTKKDIYGVISGPEGIAVAKLAQAPKFEGNIVAAAAYYLSMDPIKLAKRASEAAEARQRSKQTAAPASDKAAPVTTGDDNGAELAKIIAG